MLEIGIGMMVASWLMFMVSIHDLDEIGFPKYTTFFRGLLAGLGVFGITFVIGAV